MNSPKSNDKVSLNNNHLHETINQSCNGLPKVTSTPLSLVNVRRPSPFNSVTKSRLLGPRRYSLSDVSSVNGTLPPRHYDSTELSGPLLTSLNYKDNVSMYEETKSSGLAGRIVRYNEEAEKRKPLVQEKYNGAGLFPIVHLFKNRSSSEEPPKRNFIKIGTPDRIKCLPPPSREITNKILEEITKPSPLRMKSQVRQLNHSTENVLDALKEISRKRIHDAHEEDYEAHQDPSKKIRTDELQRPRSSKRPQDNDELNQSLNTSMTQSSKKICVYDEYAASRSSSDMSFKLNNSHNTAQNGDRAKITAKRKTTSTITEDPDRAKQVKLVTSETQTEPASTKDETDNSQKETPKPPKKPSPIRVFDAHPLENLRKNRLAALMGTLVGKEVIFQSQLEETPQDNNPKSILSTTRRNLDSLTEKHVHFDVPDTSSSSASTDISSKPPENPLQKSSTVLFPIDTIKPTETSSNSTPATSSSTPNFSFGSPKPVNSVNPVAPTMSSPSQTNVSTSKVGGFKFDLGQTMSSQKETESGAGNTSSPAVPKPQFELTSAKTTTAASSFNFMGSPAVASTTSASSSLTLPATANATSTSAPTFAFGTAAGSQAIVAPVSSAAAPPSIGFGVTTSSTTTASAASSFSFGKSTSASTTVSNPTPAFGNTAAPATTTAASSFSFGEGSAVEKATASSAFAFGSQLTTTTASLSGGGAPSFGFGSSTTAVPASSFAFGGAKTPTTMAQSTFAFSGSSTNATTTANPTLGTAVTISAPSASFNFGGSKSNAPVPAFGAGAASTTTPAFGTSTTTSTFGNSGAPPSFGGTTSGTPASAFKSPGPAPIFGGSTTNAPTFGSNTSTPAFGTTSNIFGTKTTSSTFGSATGATTPAFGSTTANSTNTPAFGNTGVNSTNAPAFGSTGANSATNIPTFGTTSTNAPAFGTAAANSTNTPAFGSTVANSTSTSAFGIAAVNSTSTPAFGSSTANSTNPPPYGSTAANSTRTSAFGNVSAGGSGAPALFGSGNTPAFGSKAENLAVVTSNSLFGGNKDATFTFGANKTAGFSSNPPAFGSTAPSATFGASAPSFGQTVNQPSSTTNNVFGGGASAGSAFGAPSGGFGPAGSSAAPAANSPFGGGASSGSTFGSAPGTTFGAQSTPNKAFSFGGTASAPQNSASPFAFGTANNNASTDVPKPSFSFTGGSTSTPVFGGGSSNPPTFGGSGTVPSFNASFGGANPAVPNAGTGGVGMFNIGAGASSGRSRPVAKAVRRRT